MSAVALHSIPAATAVRKSSKQRRAEAAALKPVRRAVWSGKVTAASFPAHQKEVEVKSNNTYAILILDLEGADKSKVYYAWFDKGCLYNLQGMIGAEVKAEIAPEYPKGARKARRCNLLNVTSIKKQHMFAYKMPDSHRAMPADARAVLQRTVTDPGLVRGVGGLSNVLINPFTRQVKQVKQVSSQLLVR